MGREAEGLEEQLKKLSAWISESQHIVFFGGAGVSTESGIPDFRSSDGLYAEKRRYPPEQIVSHSFFLSHTEQFYEFYKERMLYPEAARCIAAADMLIIGGTSLAVYPAAGLLRYFSGRRLVVINRSATPADRDADLVIQAPIGEVLSEALNPAR